MLVSASGLVGHADDGRLVFRHPRPPPEPGAPSPSTGQRRLQRAGRTWPRRVSGFSRRGSCFLRAWGGVAEAARAPGRPSYAAAAPVEGATRWREAVRARGSGSSCFPSTNRLPRAKNRKELERQCCHRVGRQWPGFVAQAQVAAAPPLATPQSAPRAPRSSPFTVPPGRLPACPPTRPWRGAGGAPGGLCAGPSTPPPRPTDGKSLELPPASPARRLFFWVMLPRPSLSRPLTTLLRRSDHGSDHARSGTIPLSTRDVGDPHEGDTNVRPQTAGSPWSERECGAHPSRQKTREAHVHFYRPRIMASLCLLLPFTHANRGVLPTLTPTLPLETGE